MCALVSAFALPGAAPAAWAEPGHTALEPPTYGAPQSICQVTDPEIGESSGVAVDGDRIFTTNDGGQSVAVYVLDATCAVTGVITGDLDPFDVEDLAFGPDRQLWLADTGDNNGDRETVAIEIVAEDGSVVLYRLSYPDGPHDAEALLVDPAGVPYVVTKEVLGRSRIYAPPGPLTAAAEPGVPVAMTQVSEVDFDVTGTEGGPVGTAGQLMVTGGAMSQDGGLVALRTYTDAYVWAVPPGGSALDALAGEPRVIALPPSPQGEAIAFAADGRSLLVTSEGTPFDLTLVPAAPPPPEIPSATPEAPGTSTGGTDPLARPVDPPQGSGLSSAGFTALTAAGLVLVCWAVLRRGRIARRGRRR